MKANHFDHFFQCFSRPKKGKSPGDEVERSPKSRNDIRHVSRQLRTQGFYLFPYFNGKGLRTSLVRPTDSQAMLTLYRNGRAPIRYVTLLQRLAPRSFFATPQPFFCVNTSPIPYDFRGGAKTIRYSSGRSRRGTREARPPYFEPKPRPKGPKKIFGDRPPPHPLSEGLDPPLYSINIGLKTSTQSYLAN